MCVFCSAATFLFRFHESLFVPLRPRFDKVVKAAAQAGLFLKHRRQGKSDKNAQRVVLVEALLGKGQQKPADLLNALHTCSAALTSMVDCRLVTHPSTSLLFTQQGRRWMQRREITKMGCHIFWNHRTREVRLFGAPDKAELLEGQVQAYLDMVTAKLTDVRFGFDKKHVKKIKIANRQLQAALHAGDMGEVERGA